MMTTTQPWPGHASGVTISQCVERLNRGTPRLAVYHGDAVQFWQVLSAHEEGQRLMLVTSRNPLEVHAWDSLCVRGVTRELVGSDACRWRGSITVASDIGWHVMAMQPGDPEVYGAAVLRQYCSAQRSTGVTPRSLDVQALASRWSSCSGLSRLDSRLAGLVA